MLGSALAFVLPRGSVSSSVKWVTIVPTFSVVTEDCPEKEGVGRGRAMRSGVNLLKVHYICI